MNPNPVSRTAYFVAALLAGCAAPEEPILEEEEEEDDEQAMLAACDDSIPDSPRTTVETFVRAWNTPRFGGRICLLHQAATPHLEYAEPQVRLSGLFALSARIELLSRVIPGQRLTLTTGVVEHHGGLNADWRLSDRRGNALAEGTLFGRLDDEGRIDRLAVFVGRPSQGPGGMQAYDDYMSAWNSAVPAERDALLARSWASEGQYIDPVTDRFSGREALSTHIEEYLGQFPGTSLVTSARIQRHHGLFRAHWTIHDSTNAPLMRGTDFGEIGPRGEIASIFSFFGELPSLGNGGWRSGCSSCAELSQSSPPDPTELCIEGTTSSLDLWHGFGTCSCTRACAAECGSNLCVGGPPTAECLVCQGSPGRILQSCPAEFSACLGDG